MPSFARPSTAEIESFLANQQSLNFTYSAVGSNQGEMPSEFNIDRNRCLLGQGEADFRSACTALRQWQMFPAGWTAILPEGVNQEPGTTVAMLARCHACWWLNACQVVYSIDETSPIRRVGFAYGTLPGHVECGEERFLIELDHDQQVWYEITAFSRPRHWLVRLAKPLARRLQRKFARESMAQMQQIVLAARISQT